MLSYDAMKLILLMILQLRFQLIFATEGNISKLERLCIYIVSYKTHTITHKIKSL